MIELKKPATVLVEAKAYRGKVHAPSKELAGAITQVLDQKYRLQQEITQKKENDNVRDVYAYSIECLVIAGRNLSIADHQKSFEIFRGNQRAVTIINFDELLSKLKYLHEYLSQEADSDVSPFDNSGEDTEIGEIEDLED